jgi:hypothetical protein
MHRFRLILAILLLFALANPRCRANELTPQQFGAKGDVVSLTDGQVRSGAAVFISHKAAFTAADIGKTIIVTGAGPSGNALVSTIQARVSKTTVTLAAKALASVSQALAYYGTDDTAAIRSCVQNGTLLGGICTISHGVTFLVSNTSSQITISGTTFVPGGAIDGSGTIVFAPRGSVDFPNDRLFYLLSAEVTHPLQICCKNSALRQGATSFLAQTAGDAGNFHSGDTGILAEVDHGGGDNPVYADWFQVESVSGKQINLVKPLRTSFPNVRTWNQTNDLLNPDGLSFRKVGDIVKAITIRDINIIIPMVGRVTGIVTRDTQDVIIVGTHCDAAAQCYAGFFDKNLTITGNRWNEFIAPEFAAAVDATIVGNVFTQKAGRLNGYSNPTAQGVLLDYGFAFGSFTGNMIGPSKNETISTFFGMHDTIISGNTLGWNIGPGAGINLLGGYRNVVSGNRLQGGSHSNGIVSTDTGTLTVQILSNANLIWNNTVERYPLGKCVCSGTSATDLCY